MPTLGTLTLADQPGLHKTAQHPQTQPQPIIPSLEEGQREED